MLSRNHGGPRATWRTIPTGLESCEAAARGRRLGSVRQMRRRQAAQERQGFRELPCPGQAGGLEQAVHVGHLTIPIPSYMDVIWMAEFVMQGRASDIRPARHPSAARALRPASRICRRRARRCGKREHDEICRGGRGRNFPPPGPSLASMCRRDAGRRDRFENCRGRRCCRAEPE